MTIKTINVSYLARVEGEGSLRVRIKDGAVDDVALKLFEPPRFFEAFLRGRDRGEVPDIVARICGICPVAYQMSAVHALESISGVTIEGPIRDLRRLIYCGEWIESHILHIYMLHAPDFLGYQDSIRLARDYPEVVRRGLQLKKIGNRIVGAVGGREIHPINVRLGGFYRAPSRRELRSLEEDLKWAREAAIETVKWTATLPFPDFNRDYEFVALRHPSEYPFNEGRLVSNRGLDIPVAEYENDFEEQHEERSTALHSVIRGRGSYLVGPMARYNLNFDRLSPLAQQVAREYDVPFPCSNPFQSIMVRGVEAVYACDEALRILDTYREPDQPYVEVPAEAGQGHAVTEAPRGILYHRYRVDSDGTVVEAKIVPPTSQNQKTIESDLFHFVSDNVDLDTETLTWKCEQAVRNYDPCISCSTHFLQVDVERT